MDAAKIGTFIKNLRIERGLTQQQIADQLHVTNRAVSKWERGLSLPDIDLLEPLAVELEVSVSELLHGDYLEVIDKSTLENTVNETISLTQFVRKNRIKVYKKCCIALLGIIAFLISFSLIQRARFYNTEIYGIVPVTVEEVEDSVLTVRGENTNPEYLRGTYKVVLRTEIPVTDYSRQHSYRASDIKNTSHLYIYYTGKRKIKNQGEIENIHKIVILENPL